jgi:diguanylate cyclase (GGDEF)-like protein
MNQSVVHCIKNALNRPTDIVARYGGEEFVRVLPDTDKAGPLYIAQSICKVVSQLGIRHITSDHHGITVSIGTAASDEVGIHGEALAALADKHLQQTKQAGRNRFFKSAELYCVFNLMHFFIQPEVGLFFR